MTEDEMVGWHHCLNGHEFEQALGEGIPACGSPWGRKQSDTTEQLNNNNSKSHYKANKDSNRIIIECYRIA